MSDYIQTTNRVMAELRIAMANLQEENRLLRKAARHRTSNAPKGWEPIEAWTDGNRIAVLGSPPDEDDDAEPAHHCDAMGCGSFGPHVLAYFDHPHPSTQIAADAPPTPDHDVMRFNVRATVEGQQYKMQAIASLNNVAKLYGPPPGKVHLERETARIANLWFRWMAEQTASAAAEQEPGAQAPGIS